ncbi:MAG: aminoacyl-tRNA hydrolase [Pseudomonadota bacterium]
MLVFVGLGNPGEKYAKHRHNIGFMAVDAIGDRHGFGPARAKFQGEVREGYLEAAGGRTKALVFKPTTYMNESGRAVQELAQFYKLAPEDFFVFYDELDLAPGKLKIKTGGGHAGHNGIRSIDAHLGNNFHRVRIGIGHPGDKSKVTGHVLGNFAKADQEWLTALLDAIAASAPKLTDGGPRFLTDVALQLAPQRKGDAEKPSSPRQAKEQEVEPPLQRKEKRGPLAEALQKLLKQKDD